MADRQRCHCGAIPTTIDGYCRQHAPARPEPTIEEQLAECKKARHQLNEALLDARRRVNEYYNVLARVKAGVIKPEDIEIWK